MDYKKLLLLKGFNLNVYDEGVFWELEISKEVTTSHNGETITLYDGKIKELCKLFGAQVDIDTDSFTDVNTVILQCKHDFTECVFCYDGNAWDVSTEEFMKCVNDFHNYYAGAKFKKKKTRSDGNFRKLRFEKTSPRILKYQSTNVRKDRTKSLGIDTGTDEQQLITANPVSRAVLL